MKRHQPNYLWNSSVSLKITLTMLNQADNNSEFKLQVSKYPPTPQPDKLLPVLKIQVLHGADCVTSCIQSIRSHIESHNLPFLQGARIAKDLCQLNTMLGFLFLRLIVDVQNFSSFRCQEEKPSSVAHSSTPHTLMLVDLPSPQLSAQIVQMFQKFVLLGVYPLLNILPEKFHKRVYVREGGWL